MTTQEAFPKVRCRASRPKENCMLCFTNPPKAGYIISLCLMEQVYSDLLYGADRHSCCTGHNEMTVFDVWPDLIQNEGNDMRLDRKEQNITLVHSLFITGGEVCSHFLKYRENTSLKMFKSVFENCFQTILLSIMTQILVKHSLLAQ